MLTCLAVCRYCYYHLTAYCHRYWFYLPCTNRDYHLRPKHIHRQHVGVRNVSYPSPRAIAILTCSRSVRFWCTISGTSDSGGAVCENWYSTEGVATTETDGESAMKGLEYQTYELHKSGPATVVAAESTKTADHESHVETTSPSTRVSGASISEASFTSIRSTASGGKSASQTVASANATATGSASHVRGYSLVWICGAAALAAFSGRAS
jgi:hypothetical protein